MPENYERRDLPYGIVVLFLVGVPVLVGLALVVTAFFPGAFSGRAAGVPDPASPGSTAARELRTLRETEADLLGSYGWVDREAGAARIPIERAIEIFLEQEERR